MRHDWRRQSAASFAATALINPGDRADDVADVAMNLEAPAQPGLADRL
jgi:hypothetical protein